MLTLSRFPSTATNWNLPNEFGGGAAEIRLYTAVYYVKMPRKPHCRRCALSKSIVAVGGELLEFGRTRTSIVHGLRPERACGGHKSRIASPWPIVKRPITCRGRARFDQKSRILIRQLPERPLFSSAADAARRQNSALWITETCFAENRHRAKCVRLAPQRLASSGLGPAGFKNHQ